MVSGACTLPYTPASSRSSESNIDGRTDIYSLGIILFECLTGQLPFSADTDYEWLMAHLEQPIPSAATLVPIPRELAELVALMMAKERAGRPQSMDRVALELQRYDKIMPVPASLTAPAPALLSFTGNRLTVTLLGAALLVGAALKLGADRMAWQKTPRKLPQTRSDQVLVPGGCFVMGSQLSELTDIDEKGQVPEHEKDQLPAHCMQVADFYLDRTEVTVSAYRKDLSMRVVARSPAAVRSAACPLTHCLTARSAIGAKLIVIITQLVPQPLNFPCHKIRRQVAIHQRHLDRHMPQQLL